MERRVNVIEILLALVILSCCGNLPAQGLSRSSGIGMRVSYWNIADKPTRFNISDGGTSSVYEVSGVGASLYFFSRVQQSNWFLQSSRGRKY
jgi:hypothetical protein